MTAMRVKANVFWPSKTQQQTRGMIPYAEHLSNGNNWRIHFSLPPGYNKPNPTHLWVQVSGPNYLLYDCPRGGVSFKISHKAVVSSRSCTY